MGESGKSGDGCSGRSKVREPCFGALPVVDLDEEEGDPESGAAGGKVGVSALAIGAEVGAVVEFDDGLDPSSLGQDVVEAPGRDRESAMSGGASRGDGIDQGGHGDLGVDAPVVFAGGV